jgi:hypothetical protein
MDEREPSPEKYIPSRDQVVEAFRAFSARGYGDPAQLPLDDPAVQRVNAMHEAWQEDAARSAASSPDPAAPIEHARSATMVYVDAGFSDPEYLERDVTDWLEQDLEDALAQGLSEVAARIQADIDAINARLAE